MKKRTQFWVAGAFFCAAIVMACQKEDNLLNGNLTTTETKTPTVIIPSNNALKTERVTLGKMLFWDPILSGNKDVACATCHHPNNAYTDGLDLSIGTNAIGYGTNRHFLSPNTLPLIKRNSMTVLNTVFNGMSADGTVNQETAPMFWDSRTHSLETQSLQPIMTLEEMRGHAYTEVLSLDSIVNRLKNIAEYRLLFKNAFGSEQTINAANIGKAIADFERTLVANNSPYDRYQKGDKTAMTTLQIEGMQAFTDVGCVNCHSGPMFSDYQLHILSVPDNARIAGTDAGANGNYSFRTASLRNVTLTAPFMHNGVFQNLNQILQFYGNIAGGNSQNPQVNIRQVDPKIRQVRIRNNQQRLIAFINALTDTNFDKSIPAKVPSNLNPGGSIKNF
ncbi:cytochrome-c peroxidase [Emticicia fontis]